MISLSLVWDHLLRLVASNSVVFILKGVLNRSFMLMNLNDIYYTSLSITVISMLTFIVCFFLFAHSSLSRKTPAKATFLFFDFMLFKPGRLSNISAISIGGTLIFGNLFDFVKNQNTSALYINSIGFISTFLFFVHCRSFSKETYNGKDVKCLNEMFTNINLSSRNLFLWLSRLSYVIMIIAAGYGE